MSVEKIYQALDSFAKVYLGGTIWNYGRSDPRFGRARSSIRKPKIVLHDELCQKHLHLHCCEETARAGYAALSQLL